MKLGATSNSSAAAFAAGDVVDVTTGGSTRKRGSVMMRNADGTYRVELDAGAGVLRSVPVGWSLQLISSGADAEATSDEEGGDVTGSNTNSVIRLSPGRGGDSPAGGPTAAAAASSSNSRYTVRCCSSSIS
jgi:hypothetical protein